MYARTRTAIHRVQPAVPEIPRRPAMSNNVDRHHRIALTSQYLTIDGSPAIPVSGELHFSRVPRSRWVERLRLMRASGVTVVASYVFWIHHQERPAVLRFDGNLDVAEFVRCADAAGLHVVLRIGPWCHGEVRNGGLPDWVLRTAPEVRTDNPGYLARVQQWFAALGAALTGMCRPGGPIIGIQIENELYDQPGHIRTLKKMARAAGLWAPLWTATAWGGAQLPPHEVLPLYGGYSDGFWVDADAPWDESFRSHFMFSHHWDDPGIGADLRTVTATWRQPDREFPLATCELGGGMATAYHRRPVPQPRDIAAIANVKIGNGSAWQGFYMYAGGTNPPGEHGMQESHATGYPNDLPRFDYDFHAPIRASGAPGEALPALREHNAFLEAFGPALASMPSALPDRRPADAYDRTTLRWALRGDADSGFVFINWHQPHEPFDDHEPVQFMIDDQLFPDRPIALPAGTIARWPVGLVVGGVRIRWATVSPLTVLHGAVPTLVLRAHRGILARIAIHGEFQVLQRNGVAARPGAGETIELTPGCCVRVQTGGGTLDVLLLDEEDLAHIWVIEGRLIRSSAPVWQEKHGLRARSSTRPRVAMWEPQLARFRELDALTAATARSASALPLTVVKAAGTPPASYGRGFGRASAPTAGDVDAIAAVFAVSLPDAGWTAGDDVVLTVSWTGDVAQLWADGRLVADRFGDGTAWEIELTTLGVTPASALALKIMPLPANAEIGFDPDISVDIEGATAPTAQTTLEHRVLWELQPAAL